MITAIYARKSTDQNIADEEKSVTRQVERARAYAARQGWTVAEEHVYVDDGISGAEFGEKRPGYLALMNALTPRAPFQALVMMEQSRLGRSLREVPYALARLGDAGVRVFCYLTETEIKRDSLTDEYLTHTMAFVDAMHRQQSRERTRDALRRKAERGHVAGGLVYGYRNVEVLEGGARSHVLREIFEREAAVVRRIFAEVAQGRGFLRIAQGLNGDGIPCPGRRSTAWAGSTIRAMVHRELYRGQLVYGRTRWADVGGTKRKVRVGNRASWVTTPAPALRIVDDELWRAAHARLRASRAVYLEQTGGRTCGRPANPAESPYLLTGLLRCAHCGGGLHVSHKSWRQRSGVLSYYVCARQRTRGIPCPGALQVRMDKLDAALVEELVSRVMTPERIGAAVRLAAARLTRSPRASATRRAALTRELRGVELELARYAEAIGRTGPLPAILDALQARERRREAIQAELGELDALERTAAVVGDVAVTARLRALCAEWRQLLTEDPSIAHQLMKRLIPERLAVARTPAGVEVTGTAAFGPLLAGVVLGEAMVPPDGFARIARQAVRVCIAA